MGTIASEVSALVLAGTSPRGGATAASSTRGAGSDASARALRTPHFWRTPFPGPFAGASASEGASAGVSCRAFTRASASAGCFCSSFGVERWCGSEDDLCRLKLETCFEELHIKHTPERSPQAPTDRVDAMMSRCRSGSPFTVFGRAQPIRRAPSRRSRLRGAPRRAPAGSHLDQTDRQKALQLAFESLHACDCQAVTDAIAEIARTSNRAVD